MGEIKQRELTLEQGEQFCIRTASETDAVSILDLYRSVLAEGRYTLLLLEEMQRTEEVERKAIADEIKRPGCLRVVAEVDGLIVGMARVKAGGLRRTAHFGDVDSVWVHSEWRRHGIGNALMDSIVRWAKGNKGIEKLGLFVFSTSEAAIALYHRNGFTIEGRAPRDIKFAEDDYADTVIMGRMVG
ncbi:MAG: GNAT family N-acetyltransferase [Anaerolineales bacterium]